MMAAAPIRDITMMLLVSLLPVVVLGGTTYTRKLQGNGAWTDPTAWSPVGIPGPSDTALIVGGIGTSFVNFTGQSPIHVANVMVNYTDVYFAATITTVTIGNLTIINGAVDVFGGLQARIVQLSASSLGLSSASIGQYDGDGESTVAAIGQLSFQSANGESSLTVATGGSVEFQGPASFNILITGNIRVTMPLLQQPSSCTSQLAVNIWLIPNTNTSNTVTEFYGTPCINVQKLESTPVSTAPRIGSTLAFSSPFGECVAWPVDAANINTISYVSVINNCFNESSHSTLTVASFFGSRLFDDYLYVTNFALGGSTYLSVAGYLQFTNVTFGLPQGVVMEPEPLYPTSITFVTPIETTNGAPLALECSMGDDYECSGGGPKIQGTLCSQFDVQLPPGTTGGPYFADCSGLEKNAKPTKAAALTP